ncbi:MAG: hypothetical protein J2P53_04100, partial [Bradyrhizobiaceae bacterium]|nr:hypothetical protein [Bradyrhizobiaceae bacterium]
GGHSGHKHRNGPSAKGDPDTIETIRELLRWHFASFLPCSTRQIGAIGKRSAGIEYEIVWSSSMAAP